MTQITTLNTVAAELVSIKTDEGNIVPAPTVFIEPSSDGEYPFLVRQAIPGPDGQLLYGAPMYVVVDISDPLDDSTSFVETHATLLPNEGEPNLGRLLSLSIPAQFLLLSNMLQNIPERFYIAVSDSPPVNSDEFIAMKDILFFASIVPAQSDDIYEPVTEKLSELGTPSFREQLPESRFGQQYEQDQIKQAIADVRPTQALLMNLFLDLLDNKKSAYSLLSTLKTGLDAFDEEGLIEKDSLLGTEKTLAMLPSLVQEMHHRAMKDDIDDEDDFEDETIEDGFFELLQGSNLRDVASLTLPSAKAQNFFEDLPDELSSMRSLLESPKHSDAAKILQEHELYSSPFPELLDKYSSGTIVVAMILNIVSIVSRYTPEEDFAYDQVHIIANWLTLPNDRSLWEVPALSLSVAQYDVKHLAQLVKLQIHGGFPYISVLLHQFGITLAKENWTASNLEERLKQGSISVTQFAEIKEFLESSPHIGSTDDEERTKIPCDGCQFIQNATSDHGASLIHNIESILLAIPVFADVHAQAQGYEFGDDSWNSSRTEYVMSFLTKAADKANR